MSALSNKVYRCDTRRLKVWDLWYGELHYRAIFSEFSLTDPAFRHQAAKQLHAARRLMRGKLPNVEITVKGSTL